jgi:hypothetical protein
LFVFSTIDKGPNVWFNDMFRSVRTQILSAAVAYQYVYNLNSRKDRFSPSARRHR